MPQIQIYKQRTQATTGFSLARPDGNALNAPAQAVGELGAALGQAGQIAERIELSKNAWQLADTTAKSLGELEQFRSELSTDEDYDTHSQRYIEKAKEIEAQVGETLKGPMLNVWRQDFRRASEANAIQVAIDAQKGKATKVRADLGNTLQSLSELTGINETTDAAVRAQARLAIEANTKTGNLTYAERNELINKFDQDTSEAQIRRDMLNDPELAERKLSAGVYQHLSGEVQAVWAGRIYNAIEAKQRHAIDQEERSYRLSERAKKDVADATAKSGDELLAKGQLSSQWIESHREDLDPEDFRYFFGKLSGSTGDAPRNVERYADLRERAGNGQDVRTEAREALRRGEIRPADFNQIIGEVENERPGWYKRGSQYIAQMAGVSDLNPDPAAAQTKATMLDQWGDWATAHSTASDREAQSAYQDIVSHNMLVQMAGLPLPKLLVGTRLEPDISATEVATVQAFQAGQIDKAEFERQAQLLQRWRAAMPQTKPKAAKP